MNSKVKEKKKGLISYLIENFNMLWFVMAVGFGGTAVAGFAVLNYTIKRTPEMKGLLSMSAMEKVIGQMSDFYQAFFHYMKGHIAFFGVLHLLALILVLTFFIAWRKKHAHKYKEILEAPDKNSVLITPALAIGMTFNVILAGGLFFVDWVGENMQDLMGIALGFWTLILIYNLVLVAKILHRQFIKDFDVSKMHFGWLLIPFSMGMAAAGGSGIAALSHDPMIARLAFFLTLIPFSMGVFLAGVKVISLFKSHYQSGFSGKIEFLPSFFIVMPIVTLLSITLFRFGHFFDNQLAGSHLSPGYFSFVTTAGWAFMVWYLVIGVVLLRDYFKNHYFDIKYFDESQWAFVCPIVSFTVLGAFVYKTTLPMPAILYVIMAFLVIDVVIIGLTLYRQARKIKLNFQALKKD